MSIQLMYNVEKINDTFFRYFLLIRDTYRDDVGFGGESKDIDAEIVQSFQFSNVTDPQWELQVACINFVLVLSVGIRCVLSSPIIAVFWVQVCQNAPEST